MCQIANRQELLRYLEEMCYLLTQDQPKSCIWAVLGHFWDILALFLDPEEVVQIISPPHATCYLESILLCLST